MKKYKQNSLDSWAMKAKAETSKHLLFYQFNCPHCEQLNVMGKTNTESMVLCSNSECRKVIILERIEKIA